MKLMSDSKLNEYIEIIEEFDQYLDNRGTCMFINGLTWTPSRLLFKTEPVRYIAELLKWIEES